MIRNIINILISAINDQFPSAQVMVITNDTEIQNMAVALKGDASSIAHTLFNIMHDPNNKKMGEATYNMVKDIVYNLAINNSPLIADIIQTINDGMNEQQTAKVTPLFDNKDEQ